MLTLEELKQLLADRLDEEELLDLLKLNSHLIVEAFSDRIEADFDRIVKEFEEDEDD